MTAVQTTYGTTLAPAFEGMIADSRDQEVESRTVESAAGIGFGKVACQGAADNGIVTSTATKFIGITVATHAIEASSPGETNPQYSTIPVLRKGVIWVQVTEAVAVDDQAYYTAAGGAISKTLTANVAIPGGKFLTSTAGAGLAILRIA